MGEGGEIKASSDSPRGGGNGISSRSSTAEDHSSGYCSRTPMVGEVEGEPFYPWSRCQGMSEDGIKRA